MMVAANLFGQSDGFWYGAGIVLIILVAIGLGRNISAKLGSMSLTVEKVHTAVNDRPHGQPTLSTQVATMADALDSVGSDLTHLLEQTNRRDRVVDAALDALGAKVQALDVRVSGLEAAAAAGAPT